MTLKLNSFWLIGLFILIGQTTDASEQIFRGLIDVRLQNTDSNLSYLDGGYGKFRYSDGSGMSLAQLALDYKVDWENDFSFQIDVNSYLDDENNGIGITQAYFKYKPIPTMNGYRYQLRVGFMYPKISLENNAIAWSSPYLLTYSTMNTWIGEEVKDLGLEASVSRLGKLTGHNYDIEIGAKIITYNDTNGALLSWHGWTQSSRQSFWNEKLKFPYFPALYPGQALENQAHVSDAFKEVDSRTGMHFYSQIKWHKKSQLLLGYYDNNGGDDFVEQGQYSWTTNFSHIAFKIKLNHGYQFIAQTMNGFSRMRVANNFDVVDINFNNSFVFLSKKLNKNRFSIRLESFSTQDQDGVWGDNNDENGTATTIGYSYQIAQNTLLHFEYNQIDSTRPSRHYAKYAKLDRSTTERQFQVGLRHYFTF